MELFIFCGAASDLRVNETLASRHGSMVFGFGRVINVPTVTDNTE